MIRKTERFSGRRHPQDGADNHLAKALIWNLLRTVIWAIPRGKGSIPLFAVTEPEGDLIRPAAGGGPPSPKGKAIIFRAAIQPSSKGSFGGGIAKMTTLHE